MSPAPLRHYAEPALTFGHGQKLESAKDGLFLFGPLGDDAAIGPVRYGVVGTANARVRFARWVSQVQAFIPGPDRDSTQYRPFPGFANIFGVEFPERPVCSLGVDDKAIADALRIGDRHLAIHQAVDLFLKPIQRYLDEEEAPVAMWFVVIPEEVYKLGRPQSSVPAAQRTPSGVLIDAKLAKAIAHTLSMFAEDNAAAVAYEYERNFHNQLKARLIEGPNRAVNRPGFSGDLRV